MAVEWGGGVVPLMSLKFASHFQKEKKKKKERKKNWGKLSESG